MTNAAPNVYSRDIPFSDADFRAIADLALDRFGLSLAESKKPLVYSRLARRLKTRKLENFSDYLELLHHSAEENERLELISALTTNVTSFFRENHHFEMLKEAMSSELADKARAGGRLRIWSAGCSSGQEPYSIAMTILEAAPDLSTKDVKILATDIDPKIVSKARAGEYPAEEVAGISASLRQKWIAPTSPGGSTYSPSDTLTSMITFNELNLMNDWPFQGPFDAIFCRNVAIYFGPDTQQRLWQRLSAMLTPGGLLFIGHSERVTGPALRDLSGVGITSYCKSRTNTQPTLQ